MVIKAWSRLLRLPNLLMITFIQLMVYFSFIHFNFIHEELALTKIESVLVLLTLLCVSVSGYIINNIYDEHIDSFNGTTSIIPRYFSRNLAWIIYTCFVIIGLILAIYLSYQTEFYFSFWIYPVSMISLWLYSSKLKCLPLVGNLFVSFIVGAIIALIPFIYWENLQELRISDYYTWADLIYRFLMLIIFAVLSNLTREIIKDIEDIDSDKSFKCMSTANYFGIKKTQFIALNIWFALLIISGSVAWFLSGFLTILCFLFIVILPAVFIFILIIKAENQQDFSKLSRYIKWFMILGSIYWCFSAN